MDRLTELRRAVMLSSNPKRTEELRAEIKRIEAGMGDVDEQAPRVLDAPKAPVAPKEHAAPKAPSTPDIRKLKRGGGTVTLKVALPVGLVSRIDEYLWLGSRQDFIRKAVEEMVDREGKHGGRG